MGPYRSTVTCVLKFVYEIFLYTLYCDPDTAKLVYLYSSGRIQILNTGTWCGIGLKAQLHIFCHPIIIVSNKRVLQLFMMTK